MRRLTLLLLFLAALAARPCGPDFPFATFVLTSGPDGDYALYTAGHLGVPQTAYRTRHLVLAWDYLTHRPLSPAEQHEAALANQHFLRYDGPNQVNSDAAPDAIKNWFAARTAFGPLPVSAPHTPEDTTIATNKTLPGNTYQTISNCLDDAYLTATRTLTARIAAYGKANPAVADWVTGQDAVFSNCGGDKNPTLPSAAPANAPVWLQQDRAYQLAAAHFYALDYDTAITQFRAIAADTASPWSPIARYLVARTIIRKASVADDQLTYPQGTPAEQQAALTQYRATLTLARNELLTLIADPKQTALHNAADDLLDYVNLRLQPDQQAQVLAARLQAPHPHHFGQALIDLTYLRTNPTDPTLAAPLNTPKPGSSDLLAWLNDITACDHTPNPYDGTPSPHTPADCARAQSDILTHLHAAHAPAATAQAWLLAALMVAQPSDPSIPELLTAAASVPATDPGYTAITYHRLRLSPRSPTTRSQLLTLLPTLDKPNASTTNLFTALNAASAPTLEDFLRTAPRRPADETSMIEQGEDVYPAPTEDVCGTKIAPNTTLLFDADAAIAFNQQLPLRLLAASAESTILPANLRYQVAQSAWARAVLLDQPAIARRMAPILIACRPAWRPVLDAYNASTTPDDLHANGLLALMRFASTEPSVRQGEERRNGFATYDSFRQNWWCMTVPQAGGTVDDFPTFQFHNTYGPQVLAQHPPPPFLTPADLAEATTEADQLRKIPSASTYFATQALAWMKQHPTDARTPDILGEADRVLRNSCRTERPYDDKTGQPIGDPNNPLLTANLAHALFDALHTNYPTSPWTKRYKTWQ